MPHELFKGETHRSEPDGKSRSAAQIRTASGPWVRLAAAERNSRDDWNRVWREAEEVEDALRHLRS